MPNTGNTFPSTGENVDRSGATNWTGPPSNIEADGSGVASCVAGGTGSDYLVGRDYQYSTDPPAGATILGVTFRAELAEFQTNEDVFAQLQDDTATLIGSSKMQNVEGSTLTVYTYGGIADTWGASLTPTIVNHANFGVRLWYTSGHSIDCDFFTVAIEYSEGGGRAGVISEEERQRGDGFVVPKGTRTPVIMTARKTYVPQYLREAA